MLKTLSNNKNIISFNGFQRARIKQQTAKIIRESLKQLNEDRFVRGSEFAKSQIYSQPIHEQEFIKKALKIFSSYDSKEILESLDKKGAWANFGNLISYQKGKNGTLEKVYISFIDPEDSQNNSMLLSTELFKAFKENLNFN